MESEDNDDNLKAFRDDDSVLDDINSLFVESISADEPEIVENVGKVETNELEQKLRTDL